MKIEKTTKYKVFQKYQSDDNAITWSKVEPEEKEYMAWDQNSIECGHLLQINGNFAKYKYFLGDEILPSAYTYNFNEIVVNGHKYTPSTSGIPWNSDDLGEDDTKELLATYTLTDSTKSGVHNGSKTLYYISLPDSVNIIEDRAFKDCANLNYINIPDSITSIGCDAFTNCVNLKSLNYQGTKEQWEAITKCDNWKDEPSIKVVHCSDGDVNVYEPYNKCETRFSLYDGRTIFHNINYINMTELLKYQLDAYRPVGTTSINIGYCVSDIRDLRKVNIKKMTVPSNVTNNTSYAFEGCENLESIKFERGTGYLNEELFSDCSKLSYIELPDSITGIDKHIFFKCPNLRSITYKGQMKQWDKIPKDDYWDTKELTYGYIKVIYCKDGYILKDNGVHIPYDKEIYNKSNTKITFKDGTTKDLDIQGEITSEAIQDKEKIVKLDIGTGATSIGESAFSGCTEIGFLKLPESIKTIEKNSFRGCSHLIAAYLPDGLESIAESSFENCSIESIVIPDNVKMIGNKAFAFCFELQKAEIGSGVKIIGDSAFQDANIRNINIPYGVEQIGVRAFALCENLHTINFNGTISQWNAIKKGEKWNDYTPAKVVHCSDGDVTL